MSLDQLVTNYGYLAVAVGTFLQSDSVLILGGLAAHRSYLELPWIIFWASVCTIFSDELLFLLGHTKGKAILEKRPRWKAQSGRVLSILDRHQAWFILLFRFLYGIRSFTPLLIGMSNINHARFTVLNILGGILWAAVIGPLGYLFGNAIESIFGNIKQHELVLFLGVVGIAVVLRLALFLKRKAGERKP